MESLTISGEGVHGSIRDKKEATASSDTVKKPAAAKKTKEATASSDNVEKPAAVKNTKENVENVKPSGDASAAGEHIVETLFQTFSIETYFGGCQQRPMYTYLKGPKDLGKYKNQVGPGIYPNEFIMKKTILDNF